MQMIPNEGRLHLGRIVRIFLSKRESKGRVSSTTEFTGTVMGMSRCLEYVVYVPFGSWSVFVRRGELHEDPSYIGEKGCFPNRGEQINKELLSEVIFE